MKSKTVLVTGANGYIGNAVAKAFSRAGWKTYGLIRRADAAADLAQHEIFPVIGSPEDLSFLEQTNGAVFDVVVSNTEDMRDPGAHLEKVGAMFDAIVKRSVAAGVEPLVMFSSGCKDYGWMKEKHGDAGLSPQTELSPLQPIPLLVPRCDFGEKLLDRSRTSYDAVVLRPTIVYGLSSSHYGKVFELAEESSTKLRLLAEPGAIMHSCHVDDCAEAYVALAEHPDRQAVAGQAFNISNDQYETAEILGQALADAYGLELELVAPTADIPLDSVHFLANSWQWISSEKIRKLTGWHERRLPFAEGIRQYRLAFEASR